MVDLGYFGFQRYIKCFIYINDVTRNLEIAENLVWILIIKLELRQANNS